MVGGRAHGRMEVCRVCHLVLRVRLVDQSPGADRRRGTSEPPAIYGPRPLTAMRAADSRRTVRSLGPPRRGVIVATSAEAARGNVDGAWRRPADLRVVVPAPPAILVVWCGPSEAASASRLQAAVGEWCLHVPVGETLALLYGATGPPVDPQQHALVTDVLVRQSYPVTIIRRLRCRTRSPLPAAARSIRRALAQPPVRRRPAHPRSRPRWRQPRPRPRR